MYTSDGPVDLSDVVVPWRELAPAPLSAGAAAMKWRRGGDHDRLQSADGRFDVMYSAHRERWFAIDWNVGTKVYGDLNDCINWCAVQPGSAP